MKFHYIAFALALSTAPVFAATGDYTLATTSGSDSQSAAQSGSVASPNQVSSTNITTQGYKDSTVRTTPALNVPGGASAFSPFNCANIGSAGASGFLVALGGSAPIESDQCNGRANVTILMQMSNAIRGANAGVADRLVTVALGVMCDQDDKMRAKMEAGSLCDHADYDGNKRAYHVARGNALGYYPDQAPRTVLTYQPGAQ